LIQSLYPLHVFRYFFKITHFFRIFTIKIESSENTIAPTLCDMELQSKQKKKTETCEIKDKSYAFLFVSDGVGARNATFPLATARVRSL